MNNQKKVKKSLFIPLQEVREALRLAGHQLPEEDETEKITIYVPGTTHMAVTWSVPVE